MYMPLLVHHCSSTTPTQVCEALLRHASSEADMPLKRELKSVVDDYEQRRASRCVPLVGAIGQSPFVIWQGWRGYFCKRFLNSCSRNI